MLACYGECLTPFFNENVGYDQAGERRGPSGTRFVTAS